MAIIAMFTASSTILLLVSPSAAQSYVGKCKTAEDNWGTVAPSVYRKLSSSRTLPKFISGCRSATCLFTFTSLHSHILSRLAINALCNSTESAFTIVPSLRSETHATSIAEWHPILQELCSMN
ncbi:hypothetical protein E4T39_02083 [Aureobasidium subglaciale]|nr:hypothetical protein E4T39_02083 [Aureobasidium subglaciale]